MNTTMYHFILDEFFPRDALEYDTNRVYTADEVEEERKNPKRKQWMNKKGNQRQKKNSISEDCRLNYMNNACYNS